MKTPILGASYVARSINAADNRMVNLYPEIVPEGGKEAAWLQRAPGLRLLLTFPTGPVRGLWSYANHGFAVAGDTLYEIDQYWNVNTIGNVSGAGPVSMSDNGTQLFVACNGPSYIYNLSTGAFGQITDINFPGAVCVGYLDGYFVFNDPNSQKLWVTSLLDGTVINPLDFASAEGLPDDIVSLIVDHREVWLFGSNSVEVWYNTGATDFPLARIQGAFNEIGCAATYSVAKLDNGLFWLGADARGQGIVYRANGYTGKRISTHAIEWHIQSYGNISDAIGYTYQQDGHSFYVLIFPSANATWVYDVSSEAWHERASWQNNAFYRHRSNCQMAFNDEIVVGDYQNGNIYAFDLNDYTDNGSTQKWLRSWRALPTGENNLNRTAQHSLQLDCQTGVGLDLRPGYDSEDIITEPDGFNLIAQLESEYIITNAGEDILTEDGEYLVLYDYDDYAYINGADIITNQYQADVGYDPQVILRWSDDGGHTWSNEHWKSMGKIGAYGYRTFWRRLGMTLKLRDRVYEISGTDPVKISIMGAELHLSQTNA